jgi:hypothetical protein
MELRLEVDQNTQQVNAAMAVIRDSTLQLQAFAAPRSGGLWDEIRAELVTAIETQGGTAEERVGPLGTELRTRMPSRGENGRTVFAPATFLGVDGPRWFLRGVLAGRAAIDDEAGSPAARGAARGRRRARHRADGSARAAAAGPAARGRARRRGCRGGG